MKQTDKCRCQYKTPSVSYTPLTKDDINKSKEYGDIIVKWRLISALNGYIQDMAENQSYEMFNIEIRRLKKHFPILYEVDKK